MRTTNLRLAAAMLMPALVVPGVASAELPARHALPLAVAQKIVDGCIAHAHSKSWALTIIVKDAGDDLVAVARMDGAGLGTLDAAGGKASTAVRFGAPTSEIQTYGFDPETKAPNALALLPGFVLMGGGVPIMAGSEMIGSVGVSGASPEEDEECAKAGIAAAARDLQ